MGFTREELLAYAGAEVPDLLPSPCRLLFVGINPGLWTAATGAHFARPGNRFYPALAIAGIVGHVIDASDGMRMEDRETLLHSGIGITNLVRRATAKASELTPEELREGGERLRATVRSTCPRVVAVAGITAYRSAFRQPKAVTGRQPRDLEGAQLWVVPNPSGLNAHDTVDSLARAYRAAADAAGLTDPGARP
ncbi:mismatch-specific DNA-glycosylase [Tsukamurella sp. 8F]|uniref:mismatch-specific DNA-glycosylase n=1 Tax=unclassified Tsukamurella TaxID=2633480 RepID=UPI0023B8C890|nr:MULTISPECIES: mismatch-specific DNA-glycosylase [unclassified Tsukamurella]MDF0529600.1 mismatch-specific DNA-glycosylase [Tsukamurella sp. 8J]MDF0585712.1 mismatch-specific DNA-glycosylase [Tsukamurella sp. 8F]